ncbi:hypothetical protein [Bradyrhizobium iriomotense]|uniref:Uncharacterized protein n=1 Tax=Bradyrhizobium iriomotense TaxID=441950 RepID=A0ABQ6BBJ8_9BRAD|nr:hypothetical protein [Bradyrhizobium iriomotense]GLR91211.1 hypothetical protein GCM10007857_79270 [Bradyrhizobium iriomotense]
MIKASAAFAAILLLAVPASAQSWSKPDAIRQAAKATANGNTGAAARRVESGPCQIGVIPIAGNLFMVETFGAFTFLDKYVRTSVDSWALDDLVVSRVRAAAAGSSVRRIPFTREELTAGRRSPRSIFHGDDARIKEFAQHVSERIPCERYVVVHRHGGTQREFGIGISKYAFDGPVHLFAMMYIRVYDGPTFKLIGEAPALMTEDTYMERLLHNPLGGPSRKLDRAMFPDKPADAAANPVLRDGVRAMLTASLDKTLPTLLRKSSRDSSY